MCAPVRSILALLSMMVLLAGMLPIGAIAQQKQLRLSEKQRALHVLNRLGFGPRPGDLERVMNIGIDRYIESQLYPNLIPDAEAEAKIKGLLTLTSSSAELYEKYPNLTALIDRLKREGEELPAFLTFKSGEAKGSKNNKADTRPMKVSGSSNSEPGSSGATGTQTGNYQQLLRDFYARHNVQQPYRIVSELQASRIIRGVSSQRQLQEVMVDFWENHFNIFAGKGADLWLLTAYDRDTIRPHTMGKFHDLLLATAMSPAMLFYLDNFQSVSPNTPVAAQRNLRRGASAQRFAPNAEGNSSAQPPTRGLNENYARELMELHTLGVDGGYTQKDVQEVARSFTGWTFTGLKSDGGPQKEPGKFFFNPRLHDNGEKIVLGHQVPANGGINDGLMVLDILTHHPSTATFIATKLCRHFVTDQPSTQLVSRVAAVFMKSDGDIRETLRAIFTSPEFNSPEAYRAKIKTPVELAISSIRSLDGETDGGPAIHQWVAKMGEPLYQFAPPTGYPDVASAWVNTGSLIERLNFSLALVRNRIPGTQLDLTRFNTGDGASGGVTDDRQIIDVFIDFILHGDVSPQTKAILMSHLSASAEGIDDAKADVATREVNRRAARREAEATGTTVGNPRVAKIAALVLGSPEFQRH